MLDRVEDALLVHQQFRKGGFKPRAAAVIRVDRLDQSLAILYQKAVKRFQVRHTLLVVGVSVRQVVRFLLGEYFLKLLGE